MSKKRRLGVKARQGLWEKLMRSQHLSQLQVLLHS